MKATADLRKNIERVKTVVFDIDGVLIDTTNSYPQAICNAIKHYRTLKKIPIEKATYEEFIQFKKNPSFNNDWDVAEGLLMYKIAKSTDMAHSLQAFLKEAREKGEGSKGIYRLLSRITDYRQDWFDKELIRKLAMEHYAGKKLCSKLYGFEPKYFHNEGTIENEKIILDRNLWEQLHVQKAILTGRNKHETEIALHRLGISESIAYTLYDGKTEYTKPSPEVLKTILDKTNTDCLIFAGDSYDDYQTVRNFSQKYNSEQVYFVQILRKGTEPFEREISFAENVNDFIKYLIEQKGKST